jgi:hypothetical protein
MSGRYPPVLEAQKPPSEGRYNEILDSMSQDYTKRSIKDRSNLDCGSG